MRTERDDNGVLHVWLNERPFLDRITAVACIGPLPSGPSSRIGATALERAFFTYTEARMTEEKTGTVLHWYVICPYKEVR